MPNLNQLLKAEIVRISRKESKALSASIKEMNGSFKKKIEDLKVRVAALELQNKVLVKAVPVKSAAVAYTDTEDNRRIRVTGKGIRSLRANLKLTQKEFSSLLGISEQAAYSLEKKDGSVRLRSTTLSKYLSLRGLGSKEARNLLAQ